MTTYKQIQLLLTSSLLSILFFSSCAKNEADIDTLNPEKNNFYFLGYREINGQEEYVTIVNDKEEKIERLTDYSPTSLAINNGDIYVSGHFKNNTIWNPVYWKNGKAVPMPIYDSRTFTTDITINNSAVYITGRTVNDLNSGYIKGKLWVNGVEEILNTPDGFNSFPNAISVNNNDVLIGGRIAEVNGNSIATIWKNNILTQLTDGSRHAIVNDVLIKGNDTYAAGYTTEGTNWAGTIWKNGTPLYTFLSPENSIQIQEMYVDSDTVHTLSTTLSLDGSDIRKVQYHKNGQFEADLAQSKTRVIAHKILVKDGDLYALVSYINDQDLNVPQLYKNGELLDGYEEYLGDFLFDMEIE